MKIRFTAALLLAVLSFAILSGCAAQAPAAPANISSPAQDTVIIPETPVPQTPAPTVPPATEAPTIPAAAPTEASLITKEEAIAIALNDAGFTADQVTRLRTEFDRDDGQPEYEVDFHQGGFEYDYEIHAETGVILSKDKDRED